MRARYPGPVGGDNRVSPVELFWARPRLGQFSLATTVAGVMRTQGPPMARLRGSMNAGGTMGESRVRQISLEQRWSTRMGS